MSKAQQIFSSLNDAPAAIQLKEYAITLENINEELLEALIEAARCGERDGMPNNPGSAPGWVAKARAAINKARNT